MANLKQHNLIPKLLFLGLFSMGLCTLTGCQIFGGRFSGASAKPIPAYNNLPSQQQLLDNLRARSAQVRQLSSSVSVSVPGAPKIKGSLQIEFPNRMRMKAGLMGVPTIDVGSNDEQFWGLLKASIPGQAKPALYYANHEAFNRSPIRGSLPLEPKSLIDSLGIMEFSPNDAHFGPLAAPGGRMKLYTVTQTPTGRQTRVTLLNATSGLIEQQALYDASNQLLGYANSSNYRNYAEQQVSLPQRVELHMIQPDGQDVKVVVDFGTFSVGTPGAQVLYGNPERMWAMPSPDGIPVIDLAQVSSVDPRYGTSAPRVTNPNQRFPQQRQQTQPQTQLQRKPYSPAGWTKRSN